MVKLFVSLTLSIRSQTANGSGVVLACTGAAVLDVNLQWNLDTGGLLAMPDGSKLTHKPPWVIGARMGSMLYSVR